MSRFTGVKEVTVSDISGERLTVPPGVYYRGKVMTKEEARNQRNRDFSTEVKAPRLAQIEQQLEEVLDVGSGT